MFGGSIKENHNLAFVFGSVVAFQFPLSFVVAKISYICLQLTGFFLGILHRNHLNDEASIDCKLN